MIEKPKRPKKIPNQDNKQPQTIQELIRRYDLDNTKIYDFLDELVLQIEEQIADNITSVETSSTTKSYSCNYINSNYVKSSSWRQAQYKNLYVKANTEVSVTFNVKSPSINWNYDIYKISMNLGEANCLTLKDVYAAIGINDWGSYQAQISKQTVISSNDYIGTLTITNNGNNTVTIKFTPTSSSKLKIKIEPYGIY